MSAASLKIEDASAARTEEFRAPVREGRVVQIVYFRGSDARCGSETLFGPSPLETAKAFCEALMLYPEHIEIQDFPDSGFAVLKSRRSNAQLAVIDATPKSERLGEALATALSTLEVELWTPILDWRELPKPPALRGGE